MRIFAIGDLHLPGQDEKPMNVFGAHWERHFEMIEANWRQQVQNGDIVLIPGDISWAMHMADAVEDLGSIAALPGQKILLRGNHDYWWSSIRKLRGVLQPGVFALQNDALEIGGVVFGGSRGWVFPMEGASLGEDDMRIFRREVGRLQISLDAARKMAGEKPIVALMHFPPLLADGLATEFSRLLEDAGVTDVVYGHLHGAGIKNGFVGRLGGVQYHLTSCDAIGFSPLLIREIGS